MIGLSPYFDIATKALEYRGIRSDIIAGNIANIDTPNYKAKDLSFETILEKESQKIQKSHQQKLSLYHTNPMHLDPVEQDEEFKASIYLRPNHAQRNDGNTVDLDVETTQMSKNSIMINTLTEAMKKRASLLKTIIDSSSRV